MLTLSNQRLALAISEDGQHVAVTDLARSTEWLLQPPFPSAKSHARTESDAIVIRHQLPEGELLYRWRLQTDHVEVTLESALRPAGGFPLPGILAPAAAVQEMALPLYQGLLIRPGAEPWEQKVLHGGHIGFSMGIAVLFAQSAGLLITHDSPVSWTATFGQNQAGLFFQFQHHACPVEGIAGATVRLFPVEKNLTGACKRYRRLLQSRAQFVTWAEKIDRRPRVKDLFGALMAFVGYNKAPEINYVQGARRLHDLGFENVLYYPLRMCHYSLDFKMGGDDPIWLSDKELGEIHAVPGALEGPWGWTFEALDDGTPERRAIFRHNDKGPIAAWKIDQHQWYQVCTPYQIEHIKKRLATDMRMMDWIHFDVNSSVPGSCCRQSHALHGNKPMTSREDIEFTRRLFAPETVGNRIVASEGFTDHNAPYYDIGSTKLMPPLNPDGRFVPVPMTMLIFHDSSAHAWWELHNYNELPGMTAEGPGSFAVSDLPHGLGSTGSGAPQLKAAMDALSGSAPHVFPFGKQYGWKDFATKESYSFTVQLDDPAVQSALNLALPIARLHKKIGQLEMLDHALLTPDGALQSTLFSNGTRILANLSNQPAQSPQHGAVAPLSWREINE